MATIGEVLQGIPRLGVQGPLDREILGISHDSRQVRSGTLFFALPGHRTDGNRYLQEAISKGAAGVVSELSAPPAPLSLGGLTWIQVKDAHLALGSAADVFFGHPSRSLSVIGVTGTNGKTTTTYFLESILKRAGFKPGVLGTVNYRLNGRTLGTAVNTTPIASEVHRLMAEMKQGGATHVAMEVSSHALALGRVEEVAFDVAVFMNLYRDHLDFHKTQDAYFEAKKHLFELLEHHRTVKPNRFAVVNADDPWTSKLQGAAPHARTRTFSIRTPADFVGEGIVLSTEGTEFQLARGRAREKVRLKLLGRHNVYNALAAAAAADCLAIPPRAVLEGLESLACVPGRLEPVSEGQPFRVLVDYAHTDSALEAVLANLKQLPHRRILTVFGCGGDRDRTKRGPMGRAACSGSDLAIVTNDNPRTEDPDQIFEDILAGLREGGMRNYRVVPDRDEAIRAAIREAADGDVVLIAGKGHEDYQILKDRTIHFDDRETARRHLRERG